MWHGLFRSVSCLCQELVDLSPLQFLQLASVVMLVSWCQNRVTWYNSEWQDYVTEFGHHVTFCQVGNTSEQAAIKQSIWKLASIIAVKGGPVMLSTWLPQ